MLNRRKTGVIAEEIAVKYLTSHNYEIIEKNFSTRWGEIDIIAYDKTNDTLVFVEVKYRSNLSYGLPQEAVNYIKQQRIIKSAMIYLKTTKRNFSNYRFDVLAIMPPNNIEHIKNAFQV